ncbi:hypothetical protein LTR10_016775 [Elasticomyces elasticus]|uniref:3-phytase n=1 Tax=Exophiala sideris TaxID=1016849 RepID=A0ABR0JPB2_9EURO|nr:hypothetical protein LTR10_016775 [Elasticomyces elasticus]KAK5037778.1 hypothetical protein LTS07_001245 [Exophiala sideris]KAK5043760.1 hypothetical protein LTR13_000114 [Exophiala sideris]KAK5067259.1 hypothetical protein LTR69_001246 [Exophiala sideris]KAK5182592.1 hypothetical protein LTR44_004983 [Eurotiomycetes sp. CCFEE 6388]
MLSQFTTVLAFLTALAASSPYTPNVRHRRQSSNSSSSTNSTLITDLSIIQSYWGQITPYADNAENYFGVNATGLPNGCQVEQAHLLQRHGARFPTSTFDDGANDENFAAKVYNFTSKANSSAQFTGPLTFLNTYQYQMGESYLVGQGASQLFQAGVTFWERYGRTLYNATPGQLAYNATYSNGTARPKPVLRTTSQSRIENSEINWALGFFGPSFLTTPNPTLANATSPFSVVIIPEGGTENNTLASYDSCFNDNNDPEGFLGDHDLMSEYVPLYLATATNRMAQYVPSGFNWTVNDTYAMQSICAYETNYLGRSDFCTLFTEEEWSGFENTLDMEYYYDYSYGNPTGRAQGIGYLQELLARLQNEYITSSNSSVNSSLTNNSASFPLNQPFYADITHDDIIVSVLTAASLDYLRDPPSLTQYPPDPNRHFILSHLTPFAGRLVTEVIGCGSPSPAVQNTSRTLYYSGQYGYKASNATYKFIRMRLNNGILPLSTIRGGYCGNRADGLCPLSAFIESQQSAYSQSNYNYVCFANYTVPFPNNGTDYDGTLFSGSAARRF